MLRCIAEYVNGGLGLHYRPGELLRDLPAEMERWLMRDSPGSFEQVVEPHVEAMDEPPVHRMMDRRRVSVRVRGNRQP